MKGKERPADGAFVTFWRILVEHPGGAGVGAALERRAARHLPRDVPQGARHRAAEADGLAHLAHQLVRAVLSRRAGLPDVHAVLRFPEGGDVPQQRRAAHGPLHPEHQLDAVRRPHAGTDDRVHLSPAAVHVRSAARQAADRGPLGRLRAAGDPPRRRGRRPAAGRRSGQVSKSTFPPARRKRRRRRTTSTPR